MSNSNRKSMNPGDIFNRLVEQAKELTTKPVENISDSLTNRSLSHIDEHYVMAKHEEIAGVVELLKEQQTYLSKLAEAVEGNEGDIKVIQDKLARQEEVLEGQLEILKKDNRACATELKEIIENNNQVDYSLFEEAFKEGSNSLVNQQRAHAVEMDRMMMSLKTSIEKNIEKMKGVIENKVETTADRGVVVNKTTLVMTILNLLLLVGYIVYDVIL